MSCQPNNKFIAVVWSLVEESLPPVLDFCAFLGCGDDTAAIESSYCAIIACSHIPHFHKKEHYDDIAKGASSQKLAP